LIEPFLMSAPVRELFLMSAPVIELFLMSAPVIELFLMSLPVIHLAASAPAAPKPTTSRVAAEAAAASFILVFMCSLRFRRRPLRRPEGRLVRLMGQM